MRFTAVLVLLASLSPAFAGEPGLIPLAPPPPALIASLGPVLSFERPSHLAVWQYYAVDRSGRFRPREPLATEPYQRAMIRSRSLIPYMID